ncbi:hypothetical protein A2U01_0049634, partial [Trifolium medium]|nr:hypothetical protein [Trifolium medium]
MLAQRRLKKQTLTTSRCKARSA